MTSIHIVSGPAGVIKVTRNYLEAILTALDIQTQTTADIRLQSFNIK